MSLLELDHLENLDWNLEDSRDPKESDEKWALRRAFMERVKYVFPKMRVVSLSYCFANIEFLGCSYKQETMDLVNQYSFGISDKWRKLKKSRKLVNINTPDFTLSNAHEKENEETDNMVVGENHVDSDVSHNSTIWSLGDIVETRNLLDEDSMISPTSHLCAPLNHQWISTDLNNIVEVEDENENVGGSQPNPSEGVVDTTTVEEMRKEHRNLCDELLRNFPALNFNGKSTPPSPSDRVDDNGQVLSSTLTNGFDEPERNELGFTESEMYELANIVLVEEMFRSKAKRNSISILAHSCVLAYKKFHEEVEKIDEFGFRCKWYIGKYIIAEGHGSSMPSARANATDKALERLKQICYTVKVKHQFIGLKELKREDLFAELSDEEEDSQETFMTMTQPVYETRSAFEIPESNRGYQMLRLLGWSGGSLGRNGDGIREPVAVIGSGNRNRLGFGAEANKKKLSQELELSDQSSLMQGRITKFLNKQMKEQCGLDLVFCPEFSAAERQAIHIAAQSIGLISISHGKGNKRHIVVSKKICMVDLVQELKQTGENIKYRLVPPTVDLS